jgi:CheY-like chemotaxis protein
MSHAPLVLLVDDHRDSLRLYDVGLSAAGFRTLTADSAHNAFARVSDVLPDVVVTDVALPGMSGLELVQRLRGLEETKDIGIVVLTGMAFPADEQDAASAGCDVFLTKPCLPDALATEVRRLVDARRAAQEHASAAIPADAPLGPAPVAEERTC